MTTNKQKKKYYFNFLEKQKEKLIIFTFPNLDLFSNLNIDKINKFHKKILIVY